jgi:hypothetical protein
MHVAHESHAWFIFNLNTRISLYLQIIHCNIYMIYNITSQSDPLHPTGHTWSTSFFVRGDESPSTLFSGLLTTAPPLTLPLSPFHTPQFKLHYLHNIIYIDDINNLRRLCRGQERFYGVCHPVSTIKFTVCKSTTTNQPLVV